MNEHELKVRQCDENFDKGAELISEAYRNLKARCQRLEDLLECKRGIEIALDNERTKNKNLTQQLENAQAEKESLEQKLNEQEQKLNEQYQRYNNLEIVNAIENAKNINQLKKDLLEAILPPVKRLFDKLESLTPDKLESFKEKGLQIQFDALVGNLEFRGIKLDYHKPGDPIDDFDPNIDLVPEYTDDESLQGTTYKSVRWGYSNTETEECLAKEKVCVYVYKKPDPTPTDEAAIDPHTPHTDPTDTTTSVVINHTEIDVTPNNVNTEETESAPTATPSSSETDNGEAPKSFDTVESDTTATPDTVESATANGSNTEESDITDGSNTEESDITNGSDTEESDITNGSDTEESDITCDSNTETAVTDSHLESTPPHVPQKAPFPID